MKLPIQARPIMRSVNSVRISDALMRGVTASECNSECGWAVGACAASAVLGPAAVAGCLIAMGGTTCRDCVGAAIDNFMTNNPGMRDSPSINFGRDAM
jgi:hypothetical protein